MDHTHQIGDIWAQKEQTICSGVGQRLDPIKTKLNRFSTLMQF